MCNHERSKGRKSVESGIKTKACLLAAELLFQYLNVRMGKPVISNLKPAFIVFSARLAVQFLMSFWDHHLLYRGSYRGAHALLNLLNELRKRDVEHFISFSQQA